MEDLGGGENPNFTPPLYHARTSIIKPDKKRGINSSTRNTRVSGEEAFMEEIKQIHDDYGYFTLEHIPMIINLAKGYHIAPNRAVDMTRDLIDEDDYI